MVDSPLFVILDMMNLLINSIVNTFLGIFNLFGRLMESLGVVSEVGGPLGFFISVFILCFVGFFIVKIFLGGGKKLVILIPLALLITYILFLSALV